MLAVTHDLEARSKFSRWWHRHVDPILPGAKKHIDQEASHAWEHIRQESASVARHVDQEARGFWRYLTESDCERVRRKDGEEAGRKCDEEYARNHSQNPPPPPPAYKYFAAAEVDCFKPGYDGRWASVELEFNSDVSVAAAEEAILEEIGDKKVCSTHHNDSNLRDGAYRWVHK